VCKTINFFGANKTRLYIPLQAALAKVFINTTLKPLLTKAFSNTPPKYNSYFTIHNFAKSLFHAVYSQSLLKNILIKNFVAIKNPIYLSHNKIQKKLS